MPRWVRIMVALLLLARLWPAGAALAAEGAGDNPVYAGAMGSSIPLGSRLHVDDNGDDGGSDGGGGDGSGSSGGNDGSGDGHDGSGSDSSSGSDHDGEGETYDHQYSFYGQVRWAGERIIVGSRELVGDDPWIAYLAPGMRLEVKGEVQGSRIQVRLIEIKYPTSWAYYLGPAEAIGRGGGWVQAWLAGASGRDLFRILPAGPKAATPLLVACYKSGSWRSVPLGLRPDLRPPEAGWWRLTGTITGSGISWSLAGPLPGSCD